MFEEKAHAVEADAQGRGRPAADVAAVQEVATKVFLGDLIGCAAGKSAQQAHGAQVRSLGLGAQAIEL